jgi:H/ACA ribonucleoprotein complex subunit 4
MWLIKSEEETDERFGKSPDNRTIGELIKSSLVIVDKHPGPTSHQITSWIKNIFKVKKAGHAGTLDPAVTGVLPVALANSTKAMPVLMGLDKEYVGTMHLHKEVPEELLRKTILKFIGKIEQLPPVRAAVARKPREKQVYFFDLLEIQEKDVLFKIKCEAGTYVRKLVHDLGLALEVGAHLTELRRTKVGNFTEEQAHSLLDVKDGYEFWKNGNEKFLREILIPIEHAILHVKRVFVKDSAIDAICHGSPVFPGGITRIQKGIVGGETVAIYSLREELVALGIAKLTSDEMLKAKKGTAIRTDRVFMKKGTYPHPNI